MKLSTPPSLVHHLLSTAAFLLLGGTIAEAIERISISENGDEVADSCFVHDITPNGQFVVFSTLSSGLGPVDSNGDFDIYLLDRSDDSIELISVDSDENQHTDGMGVGAASISNDGRFVAFESLSGDFVSGDTNGKVDIFVRDRQSGGNTTRVSVSDGETQLTGNSRGSISGNGMFLVFTCDSDDAVTGDTNMGQDVFRRDLLYGATIRVSISDGEMEPVYPMSGSSFSPTISDDGNRIGFLSSAENLVTDDDNGYNDMFVRDVTSGTTTRVSLTSTGEQQENGGCNEVGVISANGLSVAFGSSADYLLPGDDNGRTDVFAREIAANNLELVSVATNSSTVLTDGFTSFPTISPDGRYVGFSSSSTDLEPRIPSIFSHGFIRDRQSKETVTVNISTTGQFADNGSTFPSSSQPPIFGDAGVYVFSSDSDELVPGDTDERDDVYQSLFIPTPTAGPSSNNSALCASLKNKLKKLKKKSKRLKKSGKVAAAKKLKKKIKKIKKQLKALGC